MEISKVIDILLWTAFGGGIGSASCMLYHKLHDNEPIIQKRIRCTTCNTLLEPINMLPIFGWIYSKGKCVTCGKAISKHHLVIECVGAGIGFGIALYL